MNNPKLLELFCGSKSISKEAEKLGIETFTVDINKRFKPDYIVNILSLDVSCIPFNPDIIWASIPCTWFSTASAFKHWNKDKTAKTVFAEAGIKTVNTTFEIINYFDPTFWWIENPRGMMRHLEIFQAYRRETVTYCQYGDNRRKPTDIWTNNDIWTPRPMCPDFGGDNVCHSLGSTDSLNTAAKRATIPAELCREILMSCQNKISPVTS